MAKLEHDVSILEKTLAIKEVQFKQMNTDIANLQRVASDKYLYTKQRTATEQRKVRGLEEKVQEITRKASEVTAYLGRLDSVADRIKKDIKERERYYKDQESVINKMIEEGNTTLRATAYEVQGLIDDKADVNRELYELNKSKNLVLEDIAALQEAVNGLDEQYEAETLKRNKQLKDIEESTAAAYKKLASVNEEVDRKLASLKTKEESLLAKQAEVRREQEELVTDKRRFDSRRSLYDDIV